MYKRQPMHKEHIGGKQGSQVMTLEKDMVTLKTEPRLLLPSIADSEGTSFVGHEFFEASSIRKIGSTYYFVYSSVLSHELCYAVSSRPDRDYIYGGTIKMCIRDSDYHDNSPYFSIYRGAEIYYRRNQRLH